MEPFEACWHRIDRAAAHRVEAVDIWNAFIEQHPYSFRLDDKGDGEFILRVWQERPTPPELAIVTGEWLYNLRSALDYSIWAAAVYESGMLPPPSEGRLQYPIYETEASWAVNLDRLKPLSDHQRARLKAMQPYNSPDPDTNFLGWINRLARVDRHRHLSHCTAYLAEVTPVIQLPEGCSAVLQLGDRVLIDGEASVARIRVTPWQEGWEIKANPRVGLDPEILHWNESPFWKKWPYNDRLRYMEIFVMGEVAILEYECTGHSRKARLLTESFMAECDARRKPKEIVHDRPPVEWDAWSAGAPSTRGRFEGRDFPPHGPGSSSGR